MDYKNKSDKYLVDALYFLGTYHDRVIGNDLEKFYDEVREVKTEIVKRMKLNKMEIR